MGLQVLTDDDYEEFSLLGYNATWAVENQETFRMNMSPSSLETKNRPSNKSA
jgi:hypothetical protein